MSSSLPVSPPRASIVIPLHRRTPVFDRCLEETVRVAGGSHDIVVVADRSPGELQAGVTVLVTGSARDTSPAEKRDRALAHVTTATCAFLDDDAFPRDDWLERGLARLELDPGAAAVGGPGITPPGSSFRERASGAFYESPFGSGGVRYRFRPLGSARDVDDLPAYNLVVRTDALRSIGGWNSKLYGGEDTMMCLRLVEDGFRLVYDPEVVVYHHRRSIMGPHLRQVGNVGRHRGYFARVLPQTSRRPLYFAPTAGCVVAVAVALASRKSRRVRAAAALAGLTGASAVAARALHDGNDPAIAAVLPAVVAASHATYGVQFARGFVTPVIDEM